MLGRGVLSRLHTLTQQETFTLTLYLDIDQNKPANRKRGFVVQADALLKDLKATHGPDRRLADANRRALDLVKKLRPRGLAALVVVHTPSKLAEIHELNLPFAASAHWRKGAFLRPIVEAMDEHERYGVVLTSTTRARLFTVHMGEIEDHDDLISDTSSRSRALGTDQWRSQKRHERRREEEVALHAKRVIDALHDLALRQPFDRLIVAGTKKATAQLVRLLPRRLQGKLVRTITMPVTASRKEVLDGVLKMKMRMEREQETALVEGLEAELHDRGKAVAGFASVLDAINQGRVWKLLYGKGLKVEGGECSDCGAYSPHAKGPCVYCGAKVNPVAQTLDRLSQTVLDMAGQVEVVDGPAGKRLEKHGSIAALLRY
jgi:peptide subunit release factor 1 (eRF1)